MENRATMPLERLKEISVKLKSFDSKQSSFILIENLFLEALYLARDSDAQLQGSTLINDLTFMKNHEYKNAQEYYKSIKAKEGSIRKFCFSFRRVMDKALVKKSHPTAIIKTN